MRILLPLLLAVLACPAMLQAADAPKSKEPLEVTADRSLEWDREAKLYIARDNAIAKQGKTELHGDTLTAAYVDGDGASGMSITRIDAVGNVKMVSDGSVATGGRGYYDVKAGYSELTGGNLMLKTPSDTVTARDKLTYNAKSRELNAYGDARAVRGDDVVNADRLVGHFADDPATGETKLTQLEALGHVVITTPNDILYGDSGLYDTASNKATITGNVRIERGPNLITGARGEVDLTTNISRIFGTGTPDGAPAAGNADGRVRGVFYPE